MQDSVNLHNIIIALVCVITLVLALTIAILLYSFHRYNIIDNKNKWTIIIDDLISKAIVFGGKEAIEETDLGLYLHKKRFRNQLLESLVATTRRFSGVAIQEVIHIFDYLELKKDVFQKVNHQKDHIVAGGIQELTAMKVKNGLHLAEKHLTSTNPIVYQEAQYAMLSLKGFEGLDFFDTFTYTLSDWQQIRLLSSIDKVSLEHNHRIQKWLFSKNPSIQIFTLRLIRKFQLLNFYAEVEQTFESENEQVKLESVKTLFALENDYTIDNFIEIFENQSQKIQLEIIEGIYKSKEKNTIPFLKQLLFHSPYISIQIKASETLIILNQTHFLETLKTQENTTISKIIAHALQEKI